MSKPFSGTAETRNAIVAVLVALALTSGITAYCTGCAGNPQLIAYRTIDDAVSGVQAGVSAYRRHCNVAPGQPGPGGCDAAEYAKVQAAYVAFQDTANRSVDIASKSGQTPLQVVSSAAAVILDLIDKSH